MSIILAYCHDDKVTMVTDTRVVIGGRKRNDTCECNLKVQKLDNGMLVGVVDSKDARQLLFGNLDIFTLDKKGNLTKKHIVTKIVPKVLDLMQANKLTIEDKGLQVLNCRILLAYKDMLYEISWGLEVIRYKKFQAAGLFSDPALAKLFSINNKKDVKKQLLEAIEVCGKYSENMSAPFVAIDTKELQYEFFEGERECI